MLANGGWDLIQRLTLILLRGQYGELLPMLANGEWDLIQRLTLALLTWTIWRAATNASKWRMGFNSAFNPYPANVDNMASSYQC